jgi:S1-C subfamily serine protease
VVRLAAILLIVGCSLARGQVARKADALSELSSTLETLAHRINPSIVQIFASGYGLSEERGDSKTVTRQRVSGSGVIISADGYIITNGHVVANANHVQLRLPTQQPRGNSILQRGGKMTDAKIVGVDQETDLALLKVEAADLPFLAFGDSDLLRQGELVMAFGSPR